MSTVTSGSFTEVVRQELSRLPPGGQGTARRELTGLLRTAGTLTLRGGSEVGPEIRIVTASGAVARRAHTLVMHGFGHRPELQVRGAGAVRHSPRYAVVLGGASLTIATELGVLDAEGRPGVAAPGPMPEVHRVALVRGALLGGGSLSRPGRQAHLEIAVGDRRVGEWLVLLVEGIVGAPPALSESGRTRLVIKSGARIGALLAGVGAVGAYLELEEQQLRRQLRADANRLANADRANLRRMIEASADQVAAVERAIQAVGWQGLDESLREIALVRLANPEASLTELGSLLDPPVGKSSVHRRLRRLEQLAGAPDTDEGEPEDP